MWVTRSVVGFSFWLVQSCLTLEASKKVYTALVQPLFDYADVAWMKSQKDDAKIFNAYKTVRVELFFEGNSLQKTHCACLALTARA